MMMPHLVALLTERFPLMAAALDSRNDDYSGSLAEWDSLANFDFLLLVEERYNVRFTLDEMTELKSLPDIARALASRSLKP